MTFPRKKNNPRARSGPVTTDALPSAAHQDPRFAGYSETPRPTTVTRDALTSALEDVTLLQSFPYITARSNVPAQRRAQLVAFATRWSPTVERLVRTYTAAKTAGKISGAEDAQAQQLLRVLSEQGRMLGAGPSTTSTSSTRSERARQYPGNPDGEQPGLARVGGRR